MKKLFTIDDFMVAFISALGYGFGESIASILGWPKIWCVVASFAVGIVTEEIVSKIVFSEAVQKKSRNRFFTFITFFLIFLIGHCISVSTMGVSMIEYLEEEFANVVILPILGFIVSLLIRWYRVRKIRKRYGDGSEGYIFDLKDKDIAETNKQNQPILGEYDASCAVKTITGIYVGERYKKTVCYLGIPYAKPPVGELRWKAPEPLPASESIYEAKNFGASAIQVEHKGSIIKHHRQSEDCLTLNIYAADQKTETKRPVLVLFHHGDFTYGGSVSPLLYGTDFVSKHPDIVFVTFNYRLGIFGFIDFSEVPGGEAYPDTLNLGLLDQIAALKWIKENITAFGGDPEQITGIGFEAGATSICLLAASEKAKGLFQKAFVFNGNLETVYNTPEGHRALARDLLKETQASTMEELMQLNTETLKDAAQKLWQNMCAPTCAVTWIPSDVYRAYQESAASGIEFVIGIPSRESQVYRSFIGNPRFKDFLTIIDPGIHDERDASLSASIKAFIEAQTAASSEQDAKSKLFNQWNALCIYRIAAKLSEGGNTVHLMYWDEQPLIDKLGSGTVDAASTLLGNSEALEMYGNVINADLSEILQYLLQKFISGTPLQLYSNEIMGVSPFDWKPYPQAIIVANGMVVCDTIEDRITEIQGLFDYMVKQLSIASYRPPCQDRDSNP